MVNRPRLQELIKEATINTENEHCVCGKPVWTEEEYLFWREISGAPMFCSSHCKDLAEAWEREKKRRGIQ